MLQNHPDGTEMKPAMFDAVTPRSPNVNCRLPVPPICTPVSADQQTSYSPWIFRSPVAFTVAPGVTDAAVGAMGPSGPTLELRDTTPAR